MNLDGERVRLREFDNEDLDGVHAIDGDPRVTTWLSFDARTVEQTKQALDGIVQRRQHDPRNEYYLAVTLPTIDHVIGFARLGLDGVNAGKLGFAVHADHWGHGYATDAARTLVAYGLTQLQLHRISAAIGPDNKASVAVVTRLGFQYEGRIRHHVHTNGAWRDSLLFSILTHEWSTAGPVAL